MSRRGSPVTPRLPWQRRGVLVDLVLSGDGDYWRKRVELDAPPPRGELVVLASGPEVVGIVVGSSTPFEDDGTVASVLLRAEPAASLPDRRTGLRRAGWLPLLEACPAPARDG